MSVISNISLHIHPAQWHYNLLWPPNATAETAKSFSPVHINNSSAAFISDCSEAESRVQNKLTATSTGVSIYQVLTDNVQEIFFKFQTRAATVGYISENIGFMAAWYVPLRDYQY